MSRYSLSLLVLCLLTASACFNPHNFSNQGRWKKDKLAEMTALHLVFTPDLSVDTCHAPYYFTPDFDFGLIAVAGVHILNARLQDRGFHTTEHTPLSLFVDSIVVVEISDMVAVYDKNQCHVGDHESYTLSLALHGRLLHRDQYYPISTSYGWQAEPKTKWPFDQIGYTNTYLDLDRVFANLWNRFSLEVYRQYTAH